MPGRSRARYHSDTKINFGGAATVTGFGTSRSSVEIPFAQFAAGGISFRPTKDWNFEADVDWTYWHSAGTVTLGKHPHR